MRVEELERLLNRHVEDIGDGLAAVADLHRFPVVALAPAILALDVHVRQEVHLDGPQARPLAGLAAAPDHIEGEPSWFVAANLGFRELGEKGSDFAEDAGVGGGVGAGRAPDGALVDGDDLVEVLEARQLFEGQGALGLLVKVVVQGGVEGLVDQGALAAAADPRHADEGAEGEPEVHRLQVVTGCTEQAELFPVALPAFPGYGNAPPSVEELGRHAALREVGGGRSFGHDLTSVLPRARSDVDQVVGLAHHVFVVLDHDDRVAHITQGLEAIDEALVVPLVQADAGLVEDVQDAGELGADLGGQPDALGFSSAQGPRGAVERQIVEPHVEEEAQSGVDFLKRFFGDGRLAFSQSVERTARPGHEVLQVHPHHVGQGGPGNLELVGGGLEAGPAAGGTGAFVQEFLGPALQWSAGSILGGPFDGRNDPVEPDAALLGAGLAGEDDGLVRAVQDAGHRGLIDLIQRRPGRMTG